MITNPQFQFYNNSKDVELGGTDFQITLNTLKTSHGNIPAGTIGDGPSVNPYPLRLIVKPRTFPRSGKWHDLACVGGLTNELTHPPQYTRWTADALLREAVIAEGLANYHWERDALGSVSYGKLIKNLNRRALLIWLGVLIGAKTGYKTVIPPAIIEQGIYEYSVEFNIEVNKLDFDKTINRVIEV